MKHLKTFSQIFESDRGDFKDIMSKMLFDHLMTLVTWPDFAQKNLDAWGNIVIDNKWKTYMKFLDSGEATPGDDKAMSQGEYESKRAQYNPTDSQRGIDAYTAAVMGYMDFPDEIGSHTDTAKASVEKFMELYHQPRELARIMRAEYYEDFSDLTPKWERIE
jgi:hypothetical protein